MSRILFEKLIISQLFKKFKSTNITTKRQPSSTSPHYLKENTTLCYVRLHTQFQRHVLRAVRTLQFQLADIHNDVAGSKEVMCLKSASYVDIISRTLLLYDDANCACDWISNRQTCVLVVIDFRPTPCSRFCLDKLMVSQIFLKSPCL